MKTKLKIFFKRLPYEVLQLFSMMMMVMSITALVNGVENISVYRILQLLTISVFGGAFILVAFSDIFFKNISYILRISLFVIPMFLVTFIVALMFSWWKQFALHNWLLFIGIFIGCWVVSLAIYFIMVKIKGREYTEKLIEYQNKKKDNVNMM